MSRVLILQGSPRRRGNTAALADSFAQGAKAAGHTVTEIFLRDKQIGDCLGCCACQKNGGQCIQEDDMKQVYAAMLGSDVIVLANPIYFYTWTATMKRALDRSFAIEEALTHKTFYLFSTGAASQESYMAHMLESFRLYVDCFADSRIGGYLFGCNTRAPGDIQGQPVLDRAYEMGKRI